MREFIIRLEQVSKLYGGNHSEAVKMLKAGADKETVLKKAGCTVALWDVNLEIPRGEIFIIIGLSGSGKSTVLRCLNRLHKPTGGHVYIDGRDVCRMSGAELRALRRGKVSMVFQSFGLMSHRDLLGNVAYPLEVRGVSRAEREEKARSVLKMVGLEGWEHKNCDALSGGMRQRVGIARALCSDAEILLMDEPFSALDPLVRQDMQFELLQLQRRLGKTIVFITHDIDEAFKLGDAVAIMRDGRVIQVDTPVGMSEAPADDYVRRFLSGADKSRVLTVANVMITPTSLVHLGDPASQALQEMRMHAISSVYVVDAELRLIGILGLNEALAAHRDRQTIDRSMLHEVQTVTQDTLLADIMPIAAESPYPMAVVEADGTLIGLLTKASVLSSLV